MKRYEWGRCCNTFSQVTPTIKMYFCRSLITNFKKTEDTITMWADSSSLIFAEQAIHNAQHTKLQSFNKPHFFTDECGEPPQVIVQSSWKKLLATSLHSGWTCQANTWWRVVSYCAEYQAAGSALRPGLIFYLHSFLLRIFRTIFLALYSQQTTKQGPPSLEGMLNREKRLLVWLLDSEIKKLKSVQPPWTPCWPGI